MSSQVTAFTWWSAAWLSRYDWALWCTMSLMTTFFIGWCLRPKWQDAAAYCWSLLESCCTHARWWHTERAMLWDHSQPFYLLWHHFTQYIFDRSFYTSPFDPSLCRLPSTSICLFWVKKYWEETIVGSYVALLQSIESSSCSSAVVYFCASHASQFWVRWKKGVLMNIWRGYLQSKSCRFIDHLGFLNRPVASRPTVFEGISFLHWIVCGENT